MGRHHGKYDKLPRHLISEEEDHVVDKEDILEIEAAFFRQQRSEGYTVPV